MYSETLMDHFLHPRNVGRVEGADAIARVKYPPCSDYLEVSVRLERERVSQARFKVQGCGGAIAAGSVLTKLLVHKNIEEMRAIEIEDVINSLGGLTEGKRHCARMAIDAVRLLVSQLEGRETNEERGAMFFETFV